MTPVHEIENDQLEYLVLQFAKGLQNTSAASDESTRSFGRKLDYDMVAARFYEEIILELKRELAKYQALAEADALATSPRFIFVADEPVVIPPEYRRKMNTPVVGADSTFEEL
jgi:hypothetical protein